MGGRWIDEAISRLQQDEGWAGDQAMVLQEPIDAGFRHKAGLGVREGQLPRRQVWLLEGKIDDRRADLIGDFVPEPFVVWACRPPEPRSAPSW